MRATPGRQLDRAALRRRVPLGLARLGLLLAVGPSRSGAAQAEASDRRVDDAVASDRYVIDAVLDPAQRQLRAEQHIDWTNRSSAPVHALFFHLYANAFANRETLFMREQGERVRDSALREPGGIEVLSLHAADGTDLLAHAHTDLGTSDRTQMRVDLPQPLAPGARIQLTLRFSLRLPSIVARMGVAGDFFMLAQWFPKLAKLEPDGHWESFPYHGLGEFYADFADYDLRVRVPREYVIAAPGALQSSELTPDGQRIERYVLPRAIDVAWSASRATLRVRTQAALPEGPVEVEVFAPRGHHALARAQAELLREGLLHFSRIYGPYPHRRLVLILPPRAAHAAAGMEYPGLIVGWALWPWSELDPASAVMQDVVTAHELAHQWFALLLASHEVETPMLDEGLAEWSGIDFVRARYDRAFFQRWLGLPVDLFELERAAFARMAPPPSSLGPAHGYRADELGAAVYLRPALALESIGRTWGQGRLRATLGGYAREQRFAHPTLRDLSRAFDRGYYPGFAQQVLVPMLEGKAVDTRLAGGGGDGDRGAGGGQAASALRAERDGQVPLPVTVELAGDAGRTRTELAAGAVAVELATPPAARGASIDPDRHNLLDRARGDDLLRIDPDAPSPPLLARLLVWAQLLLAGLGP